MLWIVNMSSFCQNVHARVHAVKMCMIEISTIPYVRTIAELLNNWDQSQDSGKIIQIPTNV